MIVITVINQKGGVGKTTTSVNLSAFLAEKMNVLVCDLDPQGNTTSHLGIESDGAELLAALDKPKKASLEALIRETKFGFSVIPSGGELASAERVLGAQIGAEKLLGQLLKRAGDTEKFDLCIVDCPPQLGILSVTALAAAKWVLVPVETSFFGIEGLVKVMETIDTVKERVNPDLEILGLLPCRLRKGTKAGGEIVKKLREAFEGLVFETAIHENTKLAEAPSHGVPITHYDRKSQGAADYASLADEVNNRIKTRGNK